MKTHDQNKAIAEYLGYEVLVGEGFVRGTYEKNMYRIRGKTDWMIMPDYTSDLNAIHEAEKTLKDNRLFFRYHLALSDLQKFAGNSHLNTFHANAAERAEAFLKTIDKWVD